MLWLLFDNGLLSNRGVCVWLWLHYYRHIFAEVGQVNNMKFLTMAVRISSGSHSTIPTSCKIYKSIYAQLLQTTTSDNYFRQLLQINKSSLRGPFKLLWCVLRLHFFSESFFVDCHFKFFSLALICLCFTEHTHTVLQSKRSYVFLPFIWRKVI